jgi:ApaG protein
MLQSYKLEKPKDFKYHATTRDIDVKVQSFFLHQQSEPEQNFYIWAYKIEIQNNSTEGITLIARHWYITDGNGNTHEVQGEGVVGETPYIDCREHFHYTSGTPLATPSGIMYGNYTMINDLGELFEVQIPAFSLDSPYQRKIIH